MLTAPSATSSMTSRWMKQKSNEVKNGSKTMSCGSSSSAATAAAAAAAAANSLRRVGGVNEHELKKRDAKYTRASVMMVIVFVVCNTPRFIPNVMELFISQSDFPKVSRVSSDKVITNWVPLKELASLAATQMVVQALGKLWSMPE